jgi:hypothetical protein
MHRDFVPAISITFLLHGMRSIVQLIENIEDNLFLQCNIGQNSILLIRRIVFGGELCTKLSTGHACVWRKVETPRLAGLLR